MKLYKMDVENVCPDFENEIYLDETKMLIYGNDRMNEYGDSTLLSILKGDYYDDELGYDYDALEMLNKRTGYEWDYIEIHGCCQGQWSRLYYADEMPSDELIAEIEAFYFNMVDGFKDEDGCVYYVPLEYCWKGKSGICDYLGFDIDDTLIFDPIKRIMYEYVEMEW